MATQGKYVLIHNIKYKPAHLNVYDMYRVDLDVSLYEIYCRWDLSICVIINYKTN